MAATKKFKNIQQLITAEVLLDHPDADTTTEVSMANILIGANDNYKSRDIVISILDKQYVMDVVSKIEFIPLVYNTLDKIEDLDLGIYKYYLDLKTLSKLIHNYNKNREDGSVDENIPLLMDSSISDVPSPIEITIPIVTKEKFCKHFNLDIETYNYDRENYYESLVDMNDKNGVSDAYIEFMKKVSSLETSKEQEEEFKKLIFNAFLDSGEILDRIQEQIDNKFSQPMKYQLWLNKDLYLKVKFVVVDFEEPFTNTVVKPEVLYNINAIVTSYIMRIADAYKARTSPDYNKVDFLSGFIYFDTYNNYFTYAQLMGKYLYYARVIAEYISTYNKQRKSITGNTEKLKELEKGLKRNCLNATYRILAPKEGEYGYYSICPLSDIISYYRREESKVGVSQEAEENKSYKCYTYELMDSAFMLAKCLNDKYLIYHSQKGTSNAPAGKSTHCLLALYDYIAANTKIMEVAPYFRSFGLDIDHNLNELVGNLKLVVKNTELRGVINTKNVNTTEDKFLSTLNRLFSNVLVFIPENQIYDFYHTSDPIKLELNDYSTK